MLLRGLTWLVLFQLFGTGLNVLILPMIPGPIIGLVLLLVPPAVGVMVYSRQLLADFWPLAGALLLSLLGSFLFAGWLMQKLIDRQRGRKEAGDA